MDEHVRAWARSQRLNVGDKRPVEVSMTAFSHSRPPRTIEPSDHGLTSKTPRFAHGSVSAASAIGFTETASPAAHQAPSVVAARLRRGVELPNGRMAGEADRVVHLIPVPDTRTIPDHLVTFCGMAIWAGQSDLVTVGTGMPCVPCLIAFPGPQETRVCDTADPQ